MPNEDRKLILDLSAVEKSRGPQPNDYFVCVTPEEAAALASAVAFMLDKTECYIPDCENCNEWHRLFWSLANELGPKLQARLFHHLTEWGVSTPAGPWEEERG